MYLFLKAKEGKFCNLRVQKIIVMYCAIGFITLIASWTSVEQDITLFVCSAVEALQWFELLMKLLMTLVKAS